MVLKNDRTFFGIIVTLFVLVISVPYLSGYFSGGAEFVFGGILQNPIDGNSYLAKMRIGYWGEWQFTLPYTAASGNGSYLFLFYIALGHIARFLGLSLPAVFTLARIGAGVFMAWMIYGFFIQVFEEKRLARCAFVLALFGAGLGWLFAFSSHVYSDFWVAEAFPFLSAYTNPHFPLGLGLMVWILKPKHLYSRSYLIKVITAVFIIALATPFAVVILTLVMGGVLLWDFIAVWFEAGDNRKSLKRFLTHPFLLRFGMTALIGGAVLLYELYIINTDPLLARWNRQNITSSPPLFDVLVSFSPALLLAVPGGYEAWKKGTLSSRILLFWAVGSLVLSVFPFSLQRRFFMGIYLPIAGLAVVGTFYLGKSIGRVKNIYRVILLLSILTNLMVILVGQFGVFQHDSRLFLSKAEYKAYLWLESAAKPNSVVLASPETGLYIPAYTRQRVLYGHPFETVEADRMKNLVVNLFTNASENHTTIDELKALGVTYVFYGPREKELGWVEWMLFTEEVFRYDDVVIYEVK